jgi:hypothetical protein
MMVLYTEVKKNEGEGKDVVQQNKYNDLWFQHVMLDISGENLGDNTRHIFAYVYF